MNFPKLTLALTLLVGANLNESFFPLRRIDLMSDRLKLLENIWTTSVRAFLHTRNPDTPQIDYQSRVTVFCTNQVFDNARLLKEILLFQRCRGRSIHSELQN